MKIKPYKETHMDGILSLEGDPFLRFTPDGNPPFSRTPYLQCDIGIKIAEDGRMWLCVNGQAFIRFIPTKKYHTVGSKLNPTEEVLT